MSVKGLNPRTKYEVSLRVTPADNYRYKYLNSTWIPVGESDILQKEAKHIYIHPNSKELETCTGECWMKKQINFKNVKISHNPASSHGDVSSMRAAKKRHAVSRMRVTVQFSFPQLLVHTMHKYVIEIVIKPENSSPTCFRFPETTFIAVTSYQNNGVSSSLTFVF